MKVRGMSGTIIPEVLYIETDYPANEFLFALAQDNLLRKDSMNWKGINEKLETIVCVFEPDCQIEETLWRYRYKGVRIQ